MQIKFFEVNLFCRIDFLKPRETRQLKKAVEDITVRITLVTGN